MKMSKEEMEKLGSFAGFLVTAESKFAGGAEKLSQTAIGRISTITDTIKTMFRSAGMGMLEAINPELKKMTDWLNNGGEAAKELEKGFIGWARTDDPVNRLSRVVNEGVIGWTKLVDKTAQAGNKVEHFKNRLYSLGREAATFAADKLKSVIYWIDELNNNDQFQRLNFGGKILFAFDDLMKQFKGWLDSGGQEQLNGVAATMGDILAAGLKAAAPRIAEAVLIIGKAIGTTMISGFSEALQGSFIGSLIVGALGGVAVGAAWGGVGALPGALIGAGAGAITYGITGATSSARKGAEQTSDISFFHTPEMYATGGILTRPHLGLVAEAGPEAWIPLSQRMRPRALALWDQVGSYLGVKSFADGGFVGTPALAGAGGTTIINVYMDGVVKAQVEVRSEADAEQVANQAAAVIADKLKGIFINRA